MTNLQMWSLLVGFLAPLVVSVVQQPRWSSGVRTLVTVVLCIVFGVGTVYFEGNLRDTSDVVGTILLILLSAVAFYKRVWAQVGVAQAIEQATSPKRSGSSRA